jgi:hypothetical protein
MTDTFCSEGFVAKAGGLVGGGAFTVVFFVTVSVRVDADVSSVDSASVDSASVDSADGDGDVSVIKQGGGGVENSTNVSVGVPVAFPVNLVNVVVMVTKTVALGGGPLRVMQLLRGV